MYLFKRTALFAGVIFILSACSGSTQTQDTSVPTGLTPTTTSIWKIFQMSALKSAENRWRKSNISDYQFTISYHCFCPGSHLGPWRVTVKQAQVTSVIPIEVQSPASNRDVPRPPPEEIAEVLFQTIQENIGEFEFSVNYDKTTGFPLSFYSGGEEFAIDDEFGFQTEDFVQTQR